MRCAVRACLAAEVDLQVMGLFFSVCVGARVRARAHMQGLKDQHHKAVARWSRRTSRQQRLDVHALYTANMQLNLAALQMADSVATEDYTAICP